VGDGPRKLGGEAGEEALLASESDGLPTFLSCGISDLSSRV
jgi:hypothetical protein